MPLAISLTFGRGKLFPRIFSGETFPGYLSLKMQVYLPLQTTVIQVPIRPWSFGIVLPVNKNDSSRSDSKALTLIPWQSECLQHFLDNLQVGLKTLNHHQSNRWSRAAEEWRQDSNVGNAENLKEICWFFFTISLLYGLTTFPLLQDQGSIFQTSGCNKSWRA